MNQIVPPSFLFRWSLTARRMPQLPSASGPLLGLPDSCLLPNLGQLDQKSEFAQIKLAWNDRGLGLSVSVSGRTRPPECVISELAFSDGIRVWIDTRPTQTVHRATKFCHHFVLLPAGAGSKKFQPVVRAFPVARAREDSPLPNASLVQLQSDVSQTGYQLEAWFPAEVFVGFDPTTNSKIGLHYLVHDVEFGDQSLAVSTDFPVESDPSLWQTVEFVS